MRCERAYTTIAGQEYLCIHFKIHGIGRKRAESLVIGKVPPGSFSCNLVSDSMTVRLRIRIRYPVPFRSVSSPVSLSSGAQMFAPIAQAPVRGWLSAVASLALHLVLIAGAFYWFDNSQDAVESLASMYSLRLIRLRPASQPASETASSAEEGQATGRRTAQSSVGRVTLPRRLELPKLPLPARSAQILLQPDVAANTPLNVDARVPELLIWKPRANPPVPTQRKVFVAHSKPEDRARPRFSQAPAFEAPNNEAQVTDVASAGRGSNPATLIAPPNGTTAPVRTGIPRENGPMPQVAPSQSSDANTLNVLSIPEIPVPPVGVFQLPGGNQVLTSASAADGQTTQGHNPAGQGTADSPSHAVAAVGGGPGVGRGRGLAGRSLDGGAMASTTAGTAAPASRESDPTGPLAGTVTNALAGGQAVPEPSAQRNVTKVNLPPNGRYSVLIQSSGSEGFAEAEGILSGKVVNTVYVRAGARKEWILQYCLPEAVERTLPVNGKAAPLDAPFPYLIMRPDLTFGTDIDYLIIHGIVTALGRLDQLSYIIAPEEQAEKDFLLHSLQQWQFRPGKLNEQPVALEILLIIPRD